MSKAGQLVQKKKLSLPSALVRWYERNRRNLPWRPRLGSPESVDPYRVLVSEFMLQQTQVATVVPYFERFLAEFGTLEALSAAPEEKVLRMWQGLGYYSRARNLQAAARKIVAGFNGQIPAGVEELCSLPGMGLYTAGAIASIAFGVRAPILDGNVTRVLCRLERIEGDPREPATRKRLWRLAEEILPAKDCGEFNSALMELGATVCTPRQPKCGDCPVREFCRAAAAGVQNFIPMPRKSRETRHHHRWVFCVGSGGKWLIERRPLKGRWAGLWQFPTIKADGAVPRELHDPRKMRKTPTPALPRSTRGGGKREHAIAQGTSTTKVAGLAIRNVRPLGEISHALTHRRYTFTAFVAKTPRRIERADSKWVSLQEISEYAMSRPQQRIAELLRKALESDQ
jgi:A/G-specific adenine glycosylase